MKLIDGIEYYSTKEVVFKLGIKPKCIRTWRTSGKLKYIHVKNKPFYERKIVDNIVENSLKVEELEKSGYKICYECGEKKSISFFGFRKYKSVDGEKKSCYSNDCKECVVKRYEEVKKAQKKRYWENNKKVLDFKNKEWRRNNREKDRIYNKKYRDKTKDIRREKLKLKYANNIDYKLKKMLRSRILTALRKIKNGKKCDQTLNLLGCSIKFLKGHLEKQFKPGMTWKNHGSGDDKWHVDHILPCASFDLLLEDEQRKCFHYSNLQPLWQHDNLVKNTKILI